MYVTFENHAVQNAKGFLKKSVDKEGKFVSSKCCKKWPTNGREKKVKRRNQRNCVYMCSNRHDILTVPIVAYYVFIQWHQSDSFKIAHGIQREIEMGWTYTYIQTHTRTRIGWIRRTVVAHIPFFNWPLAVTKPYAKFVLCKPFLMKQIENTYP